MCRLLPCTWFVRRSHRLGLSLGLRRISLSQVSAGPRHTCASRKLHSLVPASGCASRPAFYRWPYRGSRRVVCVLELRLEYLFVLCWPRFNASRFSSRHLPSCKETVMSRLELQSTINCPSCGFQKAETMPTNACQWFYECGSCHELLKPLPGDCCVFCSYGTVKCPPIQQGDSCCTSSGA